MISSTSSGWDTDESPRCFSFISDLSVNEVRKCNKKKKTGNNIHLFKLSHVPTAREENDVKIKIGRQYSNLKIFLLVQETFFFSVLFVFMQTISEYSIPDSHFAEGHWTTLPANDAIFFGNIRPLTSASWSLRQVFYSLVAMGALRYSFKIKIAAFRWKILFDALCLQC